MKLMISDTIKVYFTIIPMLFVCFNFNKINEILLLNNYGLKEFSLFLFVSISLISIYKLFQIIHEGN